MVKNWLQSWLEVPPKQEVIKELLETAENDNAPTWNWEKLGSFAINTAKVIQHEVWPPKPEPPKVPDSAIYILDDETAAILPNTGEDK